MSKSEQTTRIGPADTSCAERFMTARAGVWKRKREDLKKRRTPLFKSYEKSPNDLRLALEIKIIDDQIAECTQQMERENALAGASARSSEDPTGTPLRAILATTTRIRPLRSRQ
jgi:hypothetical protein